MGRSRQDVTRVYVACGTPYTILFAGQFDDEARTPWIQWQCERASRTRVFNIVVFCLPLLLSGGAGLGRGWYRRVPLDQVLRPLPTLIWWKRRPHLPVPSPDGDPVDDPLQVEATRESPEGPTPA